MTPHTAETICLLIPGLILIIAKAAEYKLLSLLVHWPNTTISKPKTPMPKILRPSMILALFVAFATTKPPQFAAAKTNIATITPTELSILLLAYLEISGCKTAPVIQPPTTIVIPVPMVAGLSGICAMIGLRPVVLIAIMAQ